jgi:Tfp pilus assembly PilM family ATPase
MGFFTKSNSDVRYGVIVDIGSGSVLAAIVSSNQNLTHPEILWSKREYTPLREISSVKDSAKSVMTSLMTVLMSLDSEGRRVFKEKTGVSKISYLQITIAAPWSHTITKTISYSNEEEFEVSSELISELQRTASLKMEEEIQQNESANNLELSVISKSTMQIIANGYSIIAANEQKATTLKIIEASSVTQNYIIEAIKDVKEKMIPASTLSQYSFMIPYFYVLQEMNEKGQDYCLVDITYEATEIGIVREGVLTHCTHTPFGAFSLAREISGVLNIPLEEAYSYIQDFELEDLKKNWTNTQKIEIKEIIDAYQNRLAELFNETGDILAIPKRIYVHGNMNTELFFKDKILSAAKIATKMDHAVYNVTKELLTKHYPIDISNKLTEGSGDTALLISAQFFHTVAYHDKFEQL